MRCANWVDFIQDFSTILPNIYDVISKLIIVEVRRENKELLYEVESLVRENYVFSRLKPKVFSCKKGLLDNKFKLHGLDAQSFPLCATVSSETTHYVESTIERLTFLYESRRVKQFDELFQKLSRVVDCIDNDVLSNKFFIAKDAFYKKVKSLQPKVDRYLSLNKFDKFKRCMDIMQTLELSSELDYYEAKFADRMLLLKQDYSVSESYDKIYNALYSLRTCYNEDYNELLSVVKARESNAELHHIVNVFSKESCSVRDIIARMTDYEVSKMLSYQK